MLKFKFQINITTSIPKKGGCFATFFELNTKNIQFKLWKSFDDGHLFLPRSNWNRCNHRFQCNVFAFPTHPFTSDTKRVHLTSVMNIGRKAERRNFIFQKLHWTFGKHRKTVLKLRGRLFSVVYINNKILFFLYQMNSCSIQKCEEKVQHSNERNPSFKHLTLPCSLSFFFSRVSAWFHSIISMSFISCLLIVNKIECANS